MRLRTTLFPIILLIGYYAGAQVSDDFSDGDFTGDPTWSGNVTDFEVDVDLRLHLNAPEVTSESYLSTPSALIDKTVWEFYCTLDFNPSSSNQLFVYLVSDQSDLSGSLNGYFVRIGNTDDEVSLYRQDGTSSTEIIDGTDDVVNLDPVNVRVKVIRDENGVWELFRDASGGMNYVSEGTVTDATYTTTAHFGFMCDYSSTRHDLFWLDDVSIEQVQVDSVIINSSTEIEVDFNQPIAQSDIELLTNYSIDGLTVNSATQSGTDESKVTLSLDGSTPLTTSSYTLDVAAALTKNNATSYNFSYTQLSLNDLLTLSDTEIELTFNDELDQISAETASNYSIDNGIGQPTSATLDASDATKVTLTLANSLFESTTFQLTMSGLENTSRNSSFSGTEDFTFVIPLIIDTVEATASNACIVRFNKALDEALAETLSNYSLDGSIGNPTSATLQPDGESVELVFGADFGDDTYTLTVDNLEDTDGNVIAPGSTDTFDYLNLAISSLAQVDDLSIKVTFNQGIDKATSETLGNYDLSEIGEPTSAIRSATDLDEVTLTWDQLYNSAYDLTVSNVSNVSGNSAPASLSESISISKATPERQLIINEFLADPTPSVELPEVEYVEVYNTSDFSVELSGFTLDGQSVASYKLEGKSYVVLTDNASTGAFSISNKVGVTSMGALTNSADAIVLKDQLGNVIDSINYDASTWYADDSKDDGGYSLELIDPLQPCSDATNWAGSTDVTGGTPGVQNSVFNDIDEIAPSLEGILVVGGDSLELTFSEPVDESTLDIDDFTLPNYSISSLLSQSYTVFYLVLTSDLESEISYTLTVENISDCLGNELGSQTYEFYYDTKPPVLERIDFVTSSELALVFDEPLNESSAEDEDNYSISGLTVDRAILQDSSQHRLQLSFDETFTQNGSYVLNYTSLEDTLSNTITASTFDFTFSSAIDSAYVETENVLNVLYSEVPSNALVTSNYLLEDTQSRPVEAQQDQTNAKRFRLRFEENFEENQDLLLYVSNIFTEDASARLPTPATTFIRDTRAPSIEELKVSSDSSLIVIFDGAVESTTSLVSANYTLEDSEQPTIVTQISADSIELLFENKFPQEKTKTLTVSGISDLYGNTMSSRRNLEFIYDTRPPQVEQVSQWSTTEVTVAFSEPIAYNTATTLTNYQVASSNPISAMVLGPDSTGVRLTFTSIDQDPNSELTMASIEDHQGNAKTATVHQFNALNPAIAQLKGKDARTLSVQFSLSVDGAEQLSNYQLVGYEVIEVSKISDVTYELSLDQDLAQGDSINLEVSNVIGTNGASLQSAQYHTVFENYFESYDLINERNIYLRFTTDFTSVSVSNFAVEDNNITFVSIDSEDPGLIRVTLDTGLAPNQPTTLQWSDLVDRYDRQVPDFSVELIDDQTAPTVSKLESDFYSVLMLTFSEPMNEPALSSINRFLMQGIGQPKSISVMNDSSVALDYNDQLIVDEAYDLIVYPIGDVSGNQLVQDTIHFQYQPPLLPTYRQVIINEIMADPSPSVDLPEVEYLELYNGSESAFDLRGLVLSDGSTMASLPSYTLEPGGYVLLVDENQSAAFVIDNVVEVDDFPSLGNTGETLVLQSVLGGIIDSLTYSLDWYGESSKDDGGYSLELIDPYGACPQSLNWLASVSNSGGTPGEENSVYRVGADGKAPFISEFVKLSRDQFTLTFNEAMDSSSLVQLSFNISGYPVSNRTILGTAYNQLSIELEEELAQGTYYEVAISGASDCSGTLMADTVITFGFGRDPEPGELVITEVMADPDPAVDLPSAEYVELFNTTGDVISLQNVRFRDSNSSRLIGDYLIADSTYVILTDADDADLFLSYGEVIGLDSWPALTNSGETLSLFTSQTIEEVVYDSDWFSDPEKKAGGYSLEIINPAGLCSGAANWDGSVDERGGTPGQQNSLYNTGPDDDQPIVSMFEVLSPTTIRFTFNEAMDSSSLITASLEGVVADQRRVEGVDFNVLTIDLIASLNEDQTVIIQLSGAADCSGNVMDLASFEVGIGVAPAFNELIISEIMADPDPVIELPSTEYLELYNRSEKLISLEGVSLIDQTDTVALPSVTIQPSSFVVLTTTAGAAGFDDALNVVGVSGWSALNNSGERLTLTHSGNLIFQVTYDQDWHTAGSADGGVSLEMKDLNNPCGGAENWTSSTATAGGTPGAPNATAAGVPDSFGPQLVSGRALGSRSILLEFSEVLNASAPNNTVFVLDPVNVVSRVTFGENQQTLVVYLEKDLQENVPMDVEVFGVVDCLGNPLSNGKLTVVLPAQSAEGDVVLNELLFNPRTEGVDFIEVYNISSKYLDLFGWKLGRIQDESVDYDQLDEHLLLGPGDHLAITVDTLVLKNQYPKGIKKLAQVSAIPAMSNTEGTVILANANEVVMDEFSYSEDFHLSFLESVDGVSLERIDPTSETQNANNWSSASSAVGYATPGYTNSQSYEIEQTSAQLSVEPKVFVPGNRSAAHQSFTTINYNLDKAGQFANITVYNQLGQPVANLGNGISLGTTGFIRWDGTSDAGSVVRRGYYVVLFEVYDGSGKSQMIKETVVVGM